MIILRQKKYSLIKPPRELTRKEEEHPFAVFAVIRINGKFAATTRAADRGEAGKIGLPGGKVDLGETGPEALIRECAEEGWKISDVGKIVSSQMIEGRPVVWYEVKSGEMLKDYPEMYKDHGNGPKLPVPRVKPILATRKAISESGYGNEFLKDY